MNIKVISYNELLECKSQGETVQLVDIREPYELEIEGLSDAIHLPMGELMDRIDEIPTSQKVVFHCSSGNRSMNMMNFLWMNDLYKDNYYSLDGGYQSILEFLNNEG